MIHTPAILRLHDREIVPVRAIPFITGGDMGPRCLASILSDPEQNLLAYVLGPNNVATPMLPKHWRQYKAQLSANGPNAPDLYTRTELEILPASTFVYWEGLWRTHEVNFLPPRELIAELSEIEQSNYELEPNIRISKALAKLVFDGFQFIMIGLVETELGTAPPRSVPTIAKPDGRMRIQAEAYEHWIRLKASGANPTVNSICSTMAAWCADNGVTTKTGVTPMAGTIRNTILGGSSGWVPPTHSRDQAKAHVEQLAQVAQPTQKVVD